MYQNKELRALAKTRRINGPTLDAYHLQLAALETVHRLRAECTADERAQYACLANVTDYIVDVWPYGKHIPLLRVHVHRSDVWHAALGISIEDAYR